MTTYSIYKNMSNHKNLYDVIAYNPEIAVNHLHNFKAFWQKLGNYQGIVTDLLDNPDSYTFASSNPYAVLRFEKPSILARLLNINESQVRWNKQIDTLLAQKLNQILTDLAKPVALEAGVDHKAVACMNNETLKEYLLPEIQLPYVPVIMKDHYIPVSSDVKLMTNRSIQPLSSLGKIHLKVQDEMQYFQYNNRIIEANSFSDVSSLMSIPTERYPFDYIDTTGDSLLFTKDNSYPVPAMIGDM